MSMFWSPEPMNVTSNGKKNLADVIKLRMLRREVILDHQGRFYEVISILIRGTQEDQSQRGRRCGYRSR